MKPVGLHLALQSLCSDVGKSVTDVNEDIARAECLVIEWSFVFWFVER